jgi:hypothetical protein
MKNITQTRKFPASSLFEAEVPKKVQEAQNAFHEWTSEEKRDEIEIKEKRAEIIKLLPQKLKDELTKMNVELPMDKVDLNVKLGGFLFDLYCVACPPPKAPLAIHIFQKKAMDFATELDKDEILHIPEVMDAAKQVLNDDLKWQSANISAWIDLPEKDGQPQKYFMVINNEGARLFNNVINAAVVAICDKEDDSKKA